MTAPEVSNEALLNAVALLEAINQYRMEDAAALLNAIYVDGGKNAVLQATGVLLSAWRALAQHLPDEAVDTVAQLRIWALGQQVIG